MSLFLGARSGYSAVAILTCDIGTTGKNVQKYADLYKYVIDAPANKNKHLQLPVCDETSELRARIGDGEGETIKFKPFCFLNY